MCLKCELVPTLSGRRQQFDISRESHDEPPDVTPPYAARLLTDRYPYFRRVDIKGRHGGAEQFGPKVAHDVDHYRFFGV